MINNRNMVIQRQENNLVISIATTIDMKLLEGFIQYLRIVELLSQNKGTEEQAMQLAEEAKENWWEINKQQFLS
jgi:hypothetical protein